MRIFSAWSEINLNTWGTWSQQVLGLYTNWNIPDLLDLFDKYNVVGIIEMDSSISASIIYQTIANDTAEVLFLASAKQHRGQGRMKELMIFFLRKLSGYNINLEVDERNQVAIKMYTNLGFEEVGRRSKYYNNQHDAIVMSRLAI